VKANVALNVRRKEQEFHGNESWKLADLGSQELGQAIHAGERHVRKKPGRKPSKLGSGRAEELVIFGSGWPSNWDKLGMTDQ
jgi:hypothetical protein